jgi:regulator of sirC expression with transglutaminase-like and TPR domain
MSKRDYPDQLNLLIHLLEDPDQDAFLQVSREILAMGSDAVQPLEEAWFTTSDQLTRIRIEEIVHSIQLDNLRSDLAIWAATGGADLLRGFLILSRYQYPALDEKKLLDDLNRITRSIWIELNDRLTSLEKIKVMNQVLFGTWEFGGEVTDMKNPDHYYLNNLLQSRRGNALSVGILYIIIAQKLMLPVKGIDLIGNFIACYAHVPDEFPNGYEPVSEVKFYINPLAGGAVFTRKEILLYLEKIQSDIYETYFKPADNLQVLRRWCSELMVAYGEKGMPEKGLEIYSFISLLS